MGKRRLRKKKFIDKQQQLRFALELIFYALLFPIFFLLLSVASAIAESFIYMGTDMYELQPLYALFVFCAEHWWQFAAALGMVSGISILFSHKIVGPIHRFEKALIQKTENPSEPVHCKVRSTDYFQEFAQRLDEFLNAPQVSEGSAQSHDPEWREKNLEIESTSLH